MSMKLGIAGNSKFEIDDDNNTIASQDIKKAIEDNYQQPDNKDNAKPNITVKD